MLAICCLSLVVVVMDISIVNVALPSMRTDLGATVTGLQWVIDAYTLVLAGFLVLAGSTADRVGRRRVFQIGLTIFGIGSLLCGLAPTIGLLIAARVVQAVGGTMLNPVAMGIVATTFTDPRERAKAIGVFASMSGLALALGPIVGGALVDAFGWRAVFWINVPIVLTAIIGAALFVPESRAPHARRPDPIGQLFMVVLLGGVVYAIIESHRLGWGSPLVIGLLVASVLALAGILIYEPRRDEPLLELRLFRSLPFSAAILLAMCGFGAFAAFLFVNTQYLQDVRGLSPLESGLCLLPLGAVVVLTAQLSGRMVAARGPLLPLLISGTALIVGSVASLYIGPATPLPAILAIYLLIGLFQGMINTPITNTAVSGMPRAMAGLAASLASSGRQTGAALGVAIAGTILGSAVGAHGAEFTHAALGVWWMLAGFGVAIVVLALLSGLRQQDPDGAALG
ncbi:DHA2 family efflux MFS transporter permease subunit [Pseudonocardiaceae bacterium YIM PH 21723]|nr:DHA2 family efflux MFS transporter permease subunit [Pseudonocardiaceae bacterium YIM PH 21723]